MARPQGILMVAAFTLGMGACGEGADTACANGCSEEVDALCAGLDVVVEASGSPVPFEALTIDPQTGERFSTIPLPRGMEDAAGCKSDPWPNFSVFECSWLSNSETRLSGPEMIADRVGACLEPKGWRVTHSQVNQGVTTRAFIRSNEEADIVLISTGLGGIQRDSVIVRVASGS